MSIERRGIGVNFYNGQAEIKVWAPLARKVSMLANNSTIPLSKDELGYWLASSAEIRPGDEYSFSIDEKKLPDPASLSQPKGVHGSSQAVDLNAFSWTDNSWKNYPLEDYIIYELHTGTFSPEGTFAGIEKKLDHLLQLGVTAIEIMPVAQFPGDRNWGYDGVFPFAVQHSYGGATGLQQLVNSCHKKGIAVVLDVVYNHLGPEGNYLGSFGPYFTGKYQTPWGAAINFDDEYCYGVRSFFIENALMWLRDFHIDALRLDAVHAIKDFSAIHFLKELKQRVNELCHHTGRDHWLIAECDLNDPKYIDPVENRGYGMDAQWMDEFHHALRVTAGGEHSGYYSDFKGIEHLAKSYKDAYVYDGQFSKHRNKFFGLKAENNPGKQFIVFSQNHDQVGNRMMGERTSTLHSFEMQKLLAAAVMFSPFLPMLFMGEEWSETNPFLYFVHHGDPELAEAVRKGRKEEFAAFHLEGEAPDPNDEETFMKSKLQWRLLDQEPHKTMLNYYREIIRLRKTQPAFKNADRKNLQVTFDQKEQTLTLKRRQGQQTVYCLMNFSKKQQAFQLPGNKNLNILLNSACSRWLGTISADATDDKNFIIVAPESIIILSNGGE